MEPPPVHSEPETRPDTTPTTGDSIEPLPAGCLKGFPMDRSSNEAELSAVQTGSSYMIAMGPAACE